MICPKCSIPYSDPKVTKCLLCGTQLIVSQIEAEAEVGEPRAKKAKTPKVQKENVFVNPASIQLPIGKNSSVCEVTEVAPFDSTGGFSKRNGKKELEIMQSQADNEALRKRLADLENFEKYHHPEPKSWYAYFGNWFAILCGLVVCWLVYVFIMSQGGMPAVYDFLRRIGL